MSLLRLCSGLWIESTGEPLLLRWVLLPGFSLVVCRLGGRVDTYYQVGVEEGTWVLKVSSLAEMTQGRRRWGLAFTAGQC